MRYQLRYTRKQLNKNSILFLKIQPLNQNFFKNFLGRKEKGVLTNGREIWYHTSSVRDGDAFLLWRDVRAVEGTGLENRRGASLRGFESHSLRHFS